MSLKSKIEAVIYASEEPVTLPQLTGLLGEEAAAELDALAAMQAQLPLNVDGPDTGKGGNTPVPEAEPGEQNAVLAEAGEASEIQPNAATDVEETSPAHMDAASGPSGGFFGEDAPQDAAADPHAARELERQVREHIRRTVDALMRDYAEADRGIEVREVAGGFRMGTKPEYHDAVRGFVKSLKPALKLTLQALETLAVVAYKQPVTAAEISEIRGVDSAGVLGGLMGRKLIATAGRKQVIGRPMLYKTTNEFLVRFGLRDVHELPSMEEFERLAGELNEQEDLPMEATEVLVERANARGDADHIREVNGVAAVEGEDTASESPEGAADAGEHRSSDETAASEPAEPAGTEQTSTAESADRQAAQS